MKSGNDFIPGKIYFAGAGPGDVDLLTLKARRLIECAHLILYAGSLVNPDVLAFARKDAEIFNTAEMNLDEQVGLMIAAARAEKIVARLHTGDPSIYGAIFEQMQAFRREGIHYEVIPGVSSAFAAAAALGIEYTLPETTQTLIFTRVGGRTPVPERERLRDLARHRCSLVIFLSTGLVAMVVDELIAAGYAPESPIAVVYRASWPDQIVVRSTIADITSQLEHHELNHQGVIILSPALNAEHIPLSYLYRGDLEGVMVRKGTAILTLSAPAAHLGRHLQYQLPQSHLYVPERFLLAEEHKRADTFGFREAISQVMQEVFGRYQELVCIMAAGIVVRELAPLLKSKHSDPAVVIVDTKGQFAISLLSGHMGGANRLAHKIAGIIEGQAVITTASDQKDLPAMDILAKESDWKAHVRSRYAKVMASFINDQPVALVVDEGLRAPPELSNFPWTEKFSSWDEAVSAGFSEIVVLTCRSIPEAFWRAAPDSIVYHPPALVLGLGCNRGTTCAEIMAAARSTLVDAGLALESVGLIATIQEKADEPGLIEACRKMNWEMVVFDRERIRSVENLPNPSIHSSKYLGVNGVAEPAALLAAGAHTLLVEKQKFPNVTVAVAVKENT